MYEQEGHCEDLELGSPEKKKFLIGPSLLFANIHMERKTKVLSLHVVENSNRHHLLSTVEPVSYTHLRAHETS